MVYAGSKLKCDTSLPYNSFNFKGCLSNERE